MKLNRLYKFLYDFCVPKVIVNHIVPRTFVSRTNTRVPEEEELITINVNSSERSRARLQLLSTPRYASSASPGLRGLAPSHPTSEG